MVEGRIHVKRSLLILANRDRGRKDWHFADTH